MRIAVNTRLLLPGRLEGIGWFTVETLKRITRSHPEHEFLFIFDRPFSEQFIFSGNITPLVVGPQSRHPLLWYLWFERNLPRVLKREKAGFFLSPDGYLSLSTDIPSLPVIHDINFMHNPEYHRWLTSKYYRHFFPRFAARATRIATVSEYSKRDICRTFNVQCDKTDVVYNGAGSIFKPLDAREKDDVKNRLTGGHDYFVFVGSFHERKNVCGLLRAYESFRKETENNVRLVLVGERMNGYSRMEKIIGNMSYAGDVIFTGRLQNEELRRTYGAAAALVFVPFFEGFGIPLLEAMNCDIPVIASNITSIPEVTGDAAHLVDPYDINSIAGGMKKIVSDHEYRELLLKRAASRRNLFSWDRTAELLWESIEKAVEAVV
jgi:glycosyltransferase involved in cell wall biosynthesis